MTFIDVYDDNDKLMGTFDIETDNDWIEYSDWCDYQIALGHTFYEIIHYQQKD